MPGGLAEWETELVPTFDIRTWTVHTLTDVFAGMISASSFRSMVTKESVLAVRNRSADDANQVLTRRGRAYSFVQSPDWAPILGNDVAALG